MASTIQIKRGTGSAVPSGLSDGELAINLDERKLYFGSSSAVVMLLDSASAVAGGGGGTTTNALTVDNATLQLDSGTTFNGSAARTISIKDGGVDSDALAANISVTQLTSSIISASGNIIAQSFTGSLKGTLNGTATGLANNPNITVDELSVNTIMDSGDTLIIDVENTGIDVTGQITASGNISSSGTVVANSFVGTLTGTATGLAGTPNITVGTIEATSLNVTNITSSIITSSIVQTEGSNVFGDAINDTQTFNGHITASGNISSSGTITANSIVGTLATAAQTNITSVGTLGSLTVTGNITANGNIVGDGDTNITNVDTISGDGTITMSDVTIDGTLNSGTPILSFTSSGYSPVGGITFAGGGDGGERYALMFRGLNENLVSLSNRHPNGRVDIRANSSTAGPSGEVTASLFTHNSVQLLLPVTSSGNISSSGDIEVNQILFDNSNHIVGHHASDGLQIRTQNSDPIVFKTNGNNIRASIASDGTVNIVGDLDVDGNIVGDDSTNITNISDIQCDSITHDGDTDTKMAFGNNSMRLTAGNNVVVTFDISGSIFSLPITASGDISSSGTITTDNLTANTFFANRIDRVDNAKIGVEFNDGIKVSGGHITSSGNISSSGAIIGNTATIDGNIRNTDGFALFQRSSTGANSVLNVRQTSTGNIAEFGTDSANELLVIGPSAHITASANISSSGNVIANSIIVGGGTFTSASLAAGGGGGAVSAVANGSNNRIATFTSADALNGEADLTFDGTNFEVARRKFSVPSSTVADAIGDVVYLGSTTSMDNGKIYFLSGSGRWALADADDINKSKGLLAVALGDASNTDGMLIRGSVTLDHDPGTIGDVLYLQTGSAGKASSTAPSGTGDVVRIIGYSLDSSNGQILFDPDKSFVELA